MTTRSLTTEKYRALLTSVLTNHAVVLATGSDYSPSKGGIQEDLDDLKNSFLAKTVTASDASLVIPKVVWQTGSTYTTWDGRARQNPNSFILNSEGNLYKVIRGGAPSTVEPTGKSLSNFQTADGYIWKFMTSISPADLLKFGTDGVIPVQDAGNSDQLAVELAAVGGAIDFVEIIQPGKGYKSITAVVRGDGTGATVTPVKNPVTGEIQSVTLNNAGSGYTWAEVVITDTDASPGSGFVGNVHIAPVFGHGKKIVDETGTSALMVSVSMDPSTLHGAGTKALVGRALLVQNLAAAATPVGQIFKLNGVATLSSVVGTFAEGDVLTDSSGNEAFVAAFESASKKVSLVRIKGSISGAVTNQLGASANIGTPTLSMNYTVSTPVVSKNYITQSTVQSPTTVKLIIKTDNQ